MADDPNDAYEVMRPMKRLPPPPKKKRAPPPTGLDTTKIGSTFCLKIQFFAGIIMLLTSCILTALTFVMAKP